MRRDLGRDDGKTPHFWAVLTALYVLLAVLFFLNAAKAQCAWCPKLNCYGAGGCPDACVCIIPPGSMVGSCYSIE